MKTDKLFYRIFLTQPSLISELIPEIPLCCQFDYTAPVVKEKELRLDGLLTPLENNDDLPLIFLEAQMQKDTEFYSRYFGGLFVYIHQYKIKRNWRGLLILNNRNQDLGSEIPYEDLLNYRVQRLFLSDLLTEENLTPNLALLKLIITPENNAVSEAQKILESAQNETEFNLRLDLVEAILVNKFPFLSIEEVQKMINLREADITQTRFYQQVLEIGRTEGVQIGLTEGEQIGVTKGTQQGEVNMVIRLLTRRCGNLSNELQERVRSLSIPELESLGEALLDFQDISDLENWLINHNSN
jgi:predicted transposase/invertase (TIGR01784 family)